MGVETVVPVLSELAFQSNFSNSTMPLMTNMFKKEHYRYLDHPAVQQILESLYLRRNRLLRGGRG